MTHRPEFAHETWGRPLPQPRVDPPATLNRLGPRAARRARGLRDPLRAPIYQPRRTPRRALPRRFPSVTPSGPTTDEAARIERRRAKAEQRKANPRTTRAQRLATLRAAAPGERLTRSDAKWVRRSPHAWADAVHRTVAATFARRKG